MYMRFSTMINIHQVTVTFYLTLRFGVLLSIMILHHLTILCIFSPSFATSPPSMAPVNLALGKSSKSSNVDGIHKSERANDGDLATRSCTLSGKDNWWYLDLGETVLVNYILMKLEFEWTALYIGVGDQPINSSAQPDVDFTTCKKFTEFPGYWIQDFKCGLDGRFVIVFSQAKSPLRIHEVEVYSSDNIDEIRKYSILYKPDLALNKNSSFSWAFGAEPSHGNDGNPYTDANFPQAYGIPIIWYVDLEAQYENPQIVFYCSSDQDKWSDLYAGISDEIPKEKNSRYWKPYDDFTVCGEYIDYPGDYSQKVDCNGSGRYAMLFRAEGEKLWVLEFAVYDTQVVAPWSVVHVVTPSPADQTVAPSSADNTVAPSSADNTVATQGMTWLLLQTAILMLACSS